MRAWTSPTFPDQTPWDAADAGPVRLFDTARGEVIATDPGERARLYVCGITPYDSTHLGHAATYVAFDLLVRAWRAAGHEVLYAQNVTDVDDPLFERATRDGVDWRELGESQTDLFRGDMEALRVIAPDHYTSVTEAVPQIVALIEGLEQAGATYTVDGDVYASVTADTAFGAVSGWARERMLEVFPERGGDPDRAGKRDPLDALVWRAHREGEPSWDSPWGPGRPGWHIECSAIAYDHLGGTFDVQAGGSDLVFPHHEMSAGHVQVAHGEPFAKAYAHAGMVALDGEKMSKSLGNLVFVSKLVRAGRDPMAVRLVLLAQHYRSDWEWTEQLLLAAEERLARWRRAVQLDSAPDARATVREVLAAMAEDLDAPRAVAAVDAWTAQALAGDAASGETTSAAGGDVRTLVDACLGVAL
ncbi:cysteine--1-D-myo-inosityl 2-amino-2-deoxy-alpha-D-glucopyranoside ligase [Nocardioidaceae bacterium]|nr:cysteine--1-D-myo-inosityl 2-amino-2-deoxy-alpha-D-glucopyranoside ligase [Nocardioidaceae bacterium]